MICFVVVKAEGVVLSLRDLFQIVYNLKKQAVHHTLDSYPSTEHYSDVKNVSKSKLDIINFLFLLRIIIKNRIVYQEL